MALVVGETVADAAAEIVIVAEAAEIGIAAVAETVVVIETAAAREKIALEWKILPFRRSWKIRLGLRKFRASSRVRAVRKKT